MDDAKDYSIEEYDSTTSGEFETKEHHITEDEYKAFKKHLKNGGGGESIEDWIKEYRRNKATRDQKESYDRSMRGI